jgi:hypothetical protein
MEIVTGYWLLVSEQYSSTDEGKFEYSIIN